VRRLTLALILVASAGAGIGTLYWRTLDYGFDYDDYHFVHPYSRTDVAAAFTGTWDPSGIELPYYRPLTIALFAARFELMGVNSVAHHALSLGLFAASAFLTGWFVYRLTGHALGGLLSIVFFAVHPAMPYSLVVWITNQMHLLEALLVLLGFCWWYAVRRRSSAWWTPLLALAIAAFLVKEDGIMLLPSIIALHLIRRRLAEPDLPPARWLFIALSAVTILVLLFIRSEALHGAASRRLPELPIAFHNYWSGLYRVFCLAPADRAWQRAASWFAVSVPLLGVLFWRRAAPRSRAALVSGVAIALLFNLPFVFVTKPEQLHFVALGGVIVLTASVLLIRDGADSRVVRATMPVVIAAAVAALAAVTTNITRDFEPFGPIVLANDDIVRRWAAVPQELRDYLVAKREPGAAQRLSPNPAAAVGHIVFGAHGSEITPDGVPYRWMAGTRMEILVSPGVRGVTIPLRNAIEVFREPAHAIVEANGRVVDRIELTTPDWRISRSALPGVAGRFTGMQRIVISIDHAWRPSEAISGSTDDRLLGLQVGEIVTTAGVPR
jgi:hypothetical protein